MRKKTNITAVGSALCLLAIATAFGKNAVAEEAGRFASRVAALRSAVEDLIGTFADRYPDGPKFLAQLDEVDEKGLEKLQREALLANPMLCDCPLLSVVRHPDRVGTHEYLGGHTFKGNGNALKLLHVKTGKTTTLVENPGGVIRSPCVHFDGKRIVFSMNKRGNFHIFEINTAAASESGVLSGEWTGYKPVLHSGEYPVRQLTSAPDVSDVDPISCIHRLNSAALTGLKVQRSKASIV